MSEHTPITAELRGKMDTLGWYDEDGNIVFTTGGMRAWEIACLAINSKTFGELCDAIDAVHAGLERENAELRERLVALENRSDSMHIGSATITVTPRLDWTGVARELRSIADTLSSCNCSNDCTNNERTGACHHAPTVEDVLREFAHGGIRIAAKHGIKAGEFDFYADEEAIAKFAAKLRLAEVEDA